MTVTSPPRKTSPPTRPARQRVQRRIVVNWRLLGITVLALVVAAPAAYAWYRYQVNQNAGALLARAENLEQDGSLRQAAGYYQQYLMVNPDDDDVLLKLVDAYVKREANSDPSDGLASLLYQAVGRVPDGPERQDLRTTLANHLYLLRRYDEAIRVAEEILSDAPESPEASRVKALATYLQTLPSNRDALTDAIAQLIEANDKVPGDVDLALTTADAARNYPAVWQSAAEMVAATAPNRGEDQPAPIDPATPPAIVADKIIDRMVEKAAEQADALFARCAYRRTHRLPGVEADLQQLLQIKPDHINGLLLGAELALQQDPQSEEAEQHLSKAIETAPRDRRAYLMLARVLQARGDSDEAIEQLLLAQSRSDDSVEVGLALAEAQLAAGQVDAAWKTRNGLNRSATELMALLEKTSRIALQNRLRLLDVQFLKQDPKLIEDATAVGLLEEIRFTAEMDPSFRRTPEWQQAAVELTNQAAEQAAENEEWDVAADHWVALAQEMPRNPDVVQAAAQALVRAGDHLAAIDHIESYGDVPQLTDALAVRLAQAHLFRQLKRPMGDRNWAEFDQVFQQVRQQVGPHIDLFRIQVERLLSDGNLTADDSPQAAELAGVLDAGQESLADEAEFWRIAANAYLRIDRQQDAQEAINRYLELEADGVRQVQAEVQFLTLQEKFDEAASLLEEQSKALTAEEARQLVPLKFEVRVAAGDPEGALELAKQLIVERPQHSELLKLSASLAIDLGNLDDARQWENTLEEVVGRTRSVRYIHGGRLLANYDNLSADQQQELTRQVTALREEYPRWAPAATLAARLAQREDNTEVALNNYREAIELGDLSTATITSFLMLLYDTNRLSEAETYLARLDAQPGSSPTLDSLAINVAVRRNRLADAVALARQGVDQKPQEPLRRIGLANLLLQSGQMAEAAAVMREAAQQFPENEEIWKGLLILFTRTGRTDDARAAVAEILDLENLDPDSKYFIAAQGYEILGDQQEAMRYYQLALTEAPQLTAARLRYAKLLSARNLTAAREQYQAILQQEPDNQVAIRDLAALLTATGNNDDWQRAQQLLDQLGESSATDAAGTDRFRALLMARRGRTRTQRLENIDTAEATLQKLVEAAGADEGLNRRALVQIYEAKAELSGDKTPLRAAQQQYQQLLDQPNPTPQDLADYVDFLLRHAVAEADSAESPPDDAGLRQDFLAEAEERLTQLQALVGNPTEISANSLASIELTARLLAAKGGDDQASEYLAQFFAAGPQASGEGQSVQYFITVGNLYTRLGRHEEAETWYRRVMDELPQAYVLVVRSLVAQGKRAEAATLCLEAAEGDPTPEEAAVLAGVLTTSGPLSEELADALAAVERAAEKHNDDIQLLQAAAVLKATQGDYDNAISLFRRLVELQPENPLALNNLATLLAERPNQLGEALEMAERAIDLAGRTAALLDTQGTVLLKMGEYDQAIAALEEATSGGARDPRYYFHLAAAYWKAERLDDAARSMEVARQLGLAESILTNDDRKLLTELDAATQPAVQGAN